MAYQDPSLAEELKAMMREDQSLQGDDIQLQRACYKKNATRLMEIISEHGWPKRSRIGDGGATAAWLIVQHADHDLEFQKGVITAMAKAVEDGEAIASQLAFLVDRVAVNEGRLQTYGTQWDRSLPMHVAEPAPLEDPEHVDERRAAVGLEPLADYIQKARDYGRKLRFVKGKGLVVEE